MNEFLIRNRKLLFLFYILVSVGLRFFSFFPSVLDHDESTYLIIGRDILNGKDLYTDVTDTKPVGIFLFYAALEFIFGSSIFWKRLVFAIVVGATGYFVSRVSLKMFRQNFVAFVSGIIYIIYVSIWTYHGRSPNTELLFNLTTISALLFFLNPGIRNYFLGGLLMGIGFIIKYLVLFDFTAILLFFFLFEMIQPETRWKFKVWTRFIIAGLAFLIPFGLTNLYFWLGPNFKDFHFITYELPGNYGSNPSFLRYITMYLDFTAKFLPISFLVYYVALKKRKPWKVKYTWFFLMWIFSVLVAMYVPGKEFSHYTIQLMLPFSMVAGLFFHSEFENGRVMGFIFSRKYGLPILGLFIIAIQIISFQNEVLKPDYEEEVSDYISKRIEKYDDVYVSNYQQIVYYLLEIESPSKYVHSNLMFTENQKAFDVKGEDEIKRIISKKPRFVIIQQNNKLVKNLIKKDYHELKDFKNKRIILYELIR